jgi:hypothetical protein
VHVEVSSLLRNELKALQNGSDVNAVRVLATRILELQEQEAGEPVFLLPCSRMLNAPRTERTKRDAERAQRDADIGTYDPPFRILAAINICGPQVCSTLSTLIS